MKSVLKYPGSKNRISSWICDNMPEHDVYLEPFGGSLSVLLNKKRSHIETVNDIDGDITNYFSVLRDHTTELVRVIEFTPFSRIEYEKAYFPCENDSDIERARKFAVKCFMGFGCGNRYRNGFKSGQQKISPNPAKAWGELSDVMWLAAERLKGVQIENLPALELISRYNTSDVFIYIDPPYLQSTRKNYLYLHEMSDVEHMELLSVLKNHPGKVMISGYDNDLYNSILSGWSKAYKSTRAECSYKRTEVLWMNYEINRQMCLNL